MTSQPAPAPEAAAPATSVAAPSPQGKIGDKQLRVLIFGYDDRALRRQVDEYKRAGYKVSSVFVVPPSEAEYVGLLEGSNFGADHIVGTAAQAKAIVDEVNPDVIITNAVYRGGYGASQDLVMFANLMNREIPSVFLPATPHITETLHGFPIYNQDGKEGQDLQDRRIDLPTFLQEQAAKLNAQGRAPGE